MAAFESVKKAVLPVLVVIFFFVINLEQILSTKSAMTHYQEALELPLDQTGRMDHIRSICNKIQMSKTKTSFIARSKKDSQELHHGSFMRIENPPAIVCFNLKVAATTWMNMFAKLYKDPKLWIHLNKTRTMYKAPNTLAPKSNNYLLQYLESGRYFTFAVVRHPFDRLLSAYRDRIIDHPTSFAASKIIPAVRKRRIECLRKPASCRKIVPTISEFIDQVLHQTPDAHWKPMFQHCSPCLVNYEAIIKLETALQDQDYVLYQSRIQDRQSLEYRHKTIGGSSDKVRDSFYKDISCQQLTRLEEMYKMDFLLFNYTSQPFFDLCKGPKG